MDLEGFTDLFLAQEDHFGSNKENERINWSIINTVSKITR